MGSGSFEANLEAEIVYNFGKDNGFIQMQATTKFHYTI